MEAINADQPIIDSTPSKKVKFILTGLLCFSYVAFGFGFNTIGPTLIDVQNQLSTTMDKVSMAFVYRAIVICACSLLFGWLFTYVNRQLTMAFGMALCGLSLGLTPFLRTVQMFYLSQCGFGVAFATIQVGLNAFLLEIWKLDCNPYMQSAHASYAIGAFLAPLVSEPFLSPDSSSSNSTSSTTASPLNLLESSKESRIYVPYSIGAALLIVSAITHVTSFIVIPYKSENRQIEARTVKNEESESLISKKLPRSYFLTAIISGAVILCFEGGIEINTVGYLQTFAVKVNEKITKSTAAFMGSALNGAYTLSRIASIFLAMKLRTVTMLYIDVIGILLGSTIIFFTCETSVIGLWIGFITLGLGFASCWPGIYAFIEERINVTNAISGLFMFATSVHTIAGPLIEGPRIESFPIIFAYVNLVSAIAVVIFFIVLHSTDFMKSRLLKNSMSQL